MPVMRLGDEELTVPGQGVAAMRALGWEPVTDEPATGSTVEEPAVAPKRRPRKRPAKQTED